MRSYCLLFIVIIAVHVSDNLAAETCPQENCLPDNQCEELVRGAASCSNKQQICCSVVKSGFRTACRHHGGECMSNCNKSLQRSVTDCPAGEVCCVLV